ncbi:2-oxo acid dehydrogenase subunit E2 [Alcaligenaceae bacterium]|nr:2-oxo acid dehydrogenase subunit E2 [Alcaligenaceae bacterium]
MGVYVIKMPDIGEGIAEVELVEWHVKEGDSVVEDQVLADVMTDKATVQVPSPVHGKVLALGGRVGEVMPVGSALIRLEVEGTGNVADDDGASPAGADAGRDDARAARAETPARTSGAAAGGRDAPDEGAHDDIARDGGAHDDAAGEGARRAPTVAVPAASAPVTAAPVPRPASAARRARPLASPAVRRRALDEGLDLRAVPGTGPVGQVTHEDLDRWLQHGAASPAAGGAGAGHSGMALARREGVEEVPVIGLRRRIAQKMQESKRHIPHFTYVEEIDVTELEALRRRLNDRWGATRGKLTILPLLARAMVLALREFPQMNARYDDEKGVVLRYAPVHLGVAAQTDAGLMVPVLRHAESHDIWGCAREVRRLADAVRNGSAQRDELSGSTITLTSLGALGGIVNTPVINYPEVAIVGVNRVVERPVVLDGAIVVRKMMNLSSSFDHRVVDGMHAAEFIQCIRAYLECPSMLFVE